MQGKQNPNQLARQKKNGTALNASYLCDLEQRKKRLKVMFPTRKRKFEKKFPPINKLIDMDGTGKQLCLRDIHVEVGEKVTSLKRKAEADTSQLRRYEKRRNYEFIKNQAVQRDFRES